jgi:acyl-CoA thioesterase FadM
MNLVFRLFFRLLLSAWRARRGDVLGVFDELSMRFRCWPSDIDLNLHLTNSRYHSFMDIVRVAMMIRQGTWRRLRAAKLLPVLGSSSIRYRRAVNPFQAFDVTSRLITWDEKWLYIGHRIVVGADVAATAAVKVAFIGPNGRVPTAELLAIIGHAGDPPPFDAGLVAALQGIDKALVI